MENVLTENVTINNAIKNQISNLRIAVNDVDNQFNTGKISEEEHAVKIAEITKEVESLEDYFRSFGVDVDSIPLD